MKILAQEKSNKGKASDPKAAIKSAPAKAVITPDVRKNWLRIRAAWNLGEEAFTGTLSLMDNKKANALYDVVKFALFKDSYAEVVRAHPEMRPLVQTDDDRLCMCDVYEALSNRLDRREPFPPYVAMKMRLKGGSGRDVTDLYS